MSRYDLLPPNATQLERDFSRVTSSLVRTEQQVPTIRTAKQSNIPDSVIPWLIYEYGLGEILPYVTDQRHAVTDGVLWQRIRGTPESVRVALEWIGVEGILEESEAGSDRWAEYMLGLSAPTSGDQIINRIVAVATISSPVRSRLQRIYAVYDVRRAVYDQCSWDDGSLYDDHSGVHLQPDGPQISYGQNIGIRVSFGITVSTGGSGHSEVIGVYVAMSERFRFDENQWDQGWHTINHPVLVTTLEGLSSRYEGQAWGAFKWQPTAWGYVNVVASSNVTTQTVSETDQSFGSVSMLLHLDGANNSTAIIDSSSNALTFNRFGDARIVTDSNAMGGSHLLLDGSGDYLTYSGSQISLFDFSSGVFTLELAVTFFSHKTNPPSTIISLGEGPWRLDTGSNGSAWAIGWSRPGAGLIASGFIVPLNQRTPVAISGDGTTIRMFVNGQVVGQTTQKPTGSDSVLYIGRNPQAPGGWDLPAAIDELRVTKGICRYISNYTPRTTPFPDS